MAKKDLIKEMEEAGMSGIDPKSTVKELTEQYKAFKKSQDAKPDFSNAEKSILIEDLRKQRAEQCERLKRCPLHQIRLMKTISSKIKNIDSRIENLS